ncbi:MAG: hypothetical protein A2W61_02415 [Deltaproteobacteria bacterium RIFCSPLOWO2_01_44_7]|nr:MAG: hypothetical protein A2712_04130 [Deltaproteobacteria bacterium RIFCSPHIGHO2_01_FULL_43_49]OGQ16373.1 MAG: hypothetical protein A3D22_02100 [Deltaproteobacteria bacterium RIFCSPHIGHO2_02_FULL_44_53]OGQ27801.1 MAG: hypothetical protein A3D98_08890 [Deltaproteobacteria bacterium RIFCSPHIGHO2_12_FULL_44_21]OGQ32891.1 MAG: hypothetical protein A2979_10030 [Deltaproteobacteria bacterium RIFCSPLOWO2_01_FULL_45_74]OGQ37610.1 MAG: hypothetical protein A2W61_02415 [Deltaproteobacteria bacterium 
MISSLPSLTVGFILPSTQLGSIYREAEQPVDFFELVGVQPRLGLAPSGQTVVNGITWMFGTKSPVSETALARLLRKNDFNRRSVAKKLGVSSQAISWRIHHARTQTLASLQDRISKQGRFSPINNNQLWGLLEQFWWHRRMVAEVTGLTKAAIRLRIHRANLADNTEWDGRKGCKTIKGEHSNCLHRPR